MQKKSFDIQYVLDKLNLTIEELDTLSDTGPVIDVKSYLAERKKSNIHGDGMFAKTKILKGNFIGMASVDNTYKTYLGRYTNHSSNPNIAFIYNESNDLLAKALKDIQEGEELFLDYTSHFLTPKWL